MRLQRGGREVEVPASPVTGIGLPVRYFDQLFLQATWAGGRGAQELAWPAAEAIVAQGRMVNVAGKSLRTREEILPEIVNQAKQIVEARPDLLRRLGIA
jgi:hypothetical protein